LPASRSIRSLLSNISNYSTLHIIADKGIEKIYVGSVFGLIFLVFKNSNMLEILVRHSLVRVRNDVAYSLFMTSVGCWYLPLIIYLALASGAHGTPWAVHNINNINY